MTCVHFWVCDDCPGTYVCERCGMFARFDRATGQKVELGPLCGSCSDDMGDAFDAWPSDAGELAAGDRVPCGKCGA